MAYGHIVILFNPTCIHDGYFIFKLIRIAATLNDVTDNATKITYTHPGATTRRRFTPQPYHTRHHRHRTPHPPIPPSRTTLQ